MIPLSVLDLVPIVVGSTPRIALHNSLDLARHAERLGFHRYWVAEHHNITGIASAATSVVIGYLAEGTATIRVGAGGIMLPNHSPLVIAEQFGTLASLYPERIDLGVGRAPVPASRLCAPCEGRQRPPTVFRGMCRSCRPCSAPFSRGRSSRPCRGEGLRCQSGSLGQAHSARSSPRYWDCPTLLRLTSLPTRSWTRCAPTAQASSLRIN